MGDLTPPLLVRVRSISITRETHPLGFYADKAKEHPYLGRSMSLMLVASEGFEPSKALPGDLQSPPIGRSGNSPALIS